MSASPSDGGSSTRARLRPADGDVPTARNATAAFAAFNARTSAASALFSAASASHFDASASHFAASASIRALTASSNDPTASAPAVAPWRAMRALLLPRAGGAISC